MKNGLISKQSLLSKQNIFNVGGLDEFYGDGSDGVLNTVGNITFSTGNNDLVIKQYESILINNGHTLTVSKACRGFVLYSKGDVNINGIIDMTGKAGFGADSAPIMFILDKNSKYSTDITQNTGGAAVGSGNWGAGYEKELAFNNSGPYWGSQQSGAGVNGVAYIGWNFGNGVTKRIRRFGMQQTNDARYAVTSIKLQYSDNGAAWSDVGVYSVVLSNALQIFNTPDSGAHQYWRLLANSATGESTWLVANVEFMEYLIDQKLQLLQLSTDLLQLRGGAGGAGGYGGMNLNAAYRTQGGSGGAGRVNLGGYGGGGGGGSHSYARVDGGHGGSIPFAELGNGYGTIGAVVAGGYAKAGDAQHGGGGGGGACSGSASYLATGGNGGICLGAGGGGGGGCNVYNNAAATGINGSNGGYAGGFILIIAKGNITIGATGIIRANGGNGGGGGSGRSSIVGTPASGGGGGGGAGGGVIAILRKGTYTNNGTIQVNGGAYGSGGAPDNGGEYGGNGISGSIGTIHLQQL